MGLNLDHDYHRVFNYGISHLEKSLQKNFLTEENSEDIVEIGSDVWIGKNVYIKNNVYIGHGAVVASNSYVVGDVPAYAIVGGINPYVVTSSIWLEASTLSNPIRSTGYVEII